MRRLIINADDFGFTRDVNAGIVHAHRNGVLTSTTLMANGDAFDDAVRLAHETPSLDVGCHLVLVQGNSLLTGKPLPATLAEFLPALALGKVPVEQELRLQVEKVVASGIRPTHLDTHKHTHIVPAVFRIVARLAQEFSIPYVRLPLDGSMRWSRPFYRRYLSQVKTTDHFAGFKLTGRLNERTFLSALENLPTGLTEFMCHPGYVGKELSAAKTRLKDSRSVEVEALTSPRVRELLHRNEIQLTPFIC